MQSFDEQLEFFERHAEDLRGAVEGGGADGMRAFLGSFDALERRVLCVFARRALIQGDAPLSLDVYLEVAHGGIDECLAQSRDEADEQQRRRRIDNANVISYNLAADLADCWEDEHARERRHFEAGLEAALACIRWREELDKPPFPHSIAWWARGMHELSLGEASSAQASFAKSTEFARQASGGDEDAFGVLLGRGYAAIAAARVEAATAAPAYAEVLDRFRAQLEDSERAGDAKFGMQQLQTVRSRY